MENIHNVRFDDYEDLNRFSTRDEWSAWGPERLVSAAEINMFADLTDNHQWIHEDEERCNAESPYGGLIAHGLFLATLIPGLLPDEGFTIVGHKVKIVRGIDHLRLPSPVYAGERVHARVWGLKAYPAKSGKGTIVERGVEVWSVDGRKPAVTCLLRLQYF